MLGVGLPLLQLDSLRTETRRSHHLRLHWIQWGRSHRGHCLLELELCHLILTELMPAHLRSQRGLAPALSVFACCLFYLLSLLPLERRDLSVFWRKSCLPVQHHQPHHTPRTVRPFFGCPRSLTGCPQTRLHHHKPRPGSHQTRLRHFQSRHICYYLRNLHSYSFRLQLRRICFCSLEPSSFLLGLHRHLEVAWPALELDFGH